MSSRVSNYREEFKVTVLSRDSDTVCPQCGELNPLDSDYCGLCGWMLKGAHEGGVLCPVCGSALSFGNLGKRGRLLMFCGLCFSDLEVERVKVFVQSGGVSDRVGNVLSPNLLYSNAAVASVFFPSYLVLQGFLGYTYQMHFYSTLLFLLLVLGFVGLVFRGGFSQRVYLIVFGISGLVFAEEFALNSEYIVYGLGLALAGVLVLPFACCREGWESLDEGCVGGFCLDLCY